MVNEAGLWKLRLTMVGTLAVIIGISTLAFTTILWYLDILDLYSLAVTVIAFNVLQWLISPYLVNIFYGVRPLASNEKPQLHAMIEQISSRSGIKSPQLMLSKLQIPNAFAYGSPLTGNRIAVTEGLLTDLENEEIEAVIGHEVGHIVHRDMQVMMVVSCLPSLFYFLSRSFLWNSNDRNRRDNGGVALFGAITMLVYFALTLLNLSLSRQREYYADQHASQVVNDGARKLSEGLAKISTGTYDRTSGRNVGVSSFKTLMIADPDHASQDAAVLRGGNDSELVNEVINRRISSVEGFFEIFSTHPNIVKRLRALNESLL